MGLTERSFLERMELMGFTTKPMTNADNIRSMEDSELAIFLYAKANGSGRTVEQWLDWLKREVADGER